MLLKLPGRPRRVRVEAVAAPPNCLSNAAKGQIALSADPSPNNYPGSTHHCAALRNVAPWRRFRAPRKAPMISWIASGVATQLGLSRYPLRLLPYDKVKALLRESGIRHVRDGYHEREWDLYKNLRIKSTIIFGRAINRLRTDQSTSRRLPWWR